MSSHGEDNDGSDALELLSSIRHIYAENRATDDGERCCVAPSPELQEKINKALKKMRQAAPDGMAHMAALRQLPRVGFNDGLIVPGDLLPVGTPPAVARNMGLVLILAGSLSLAFMGFAGLFSS